MSWDDIRVFLAIARTGRISAAARQLGVEHTTVGRRLAALEGDLGVALFYRTAGGYQLTEHGAAALASAEQVEAGALALSARARAKVGSVAGRVRVALLEELAACWLAPRLPELRVRYPALELRVLAGIPPLDLARGEAELAIRTPKPRQSGLAAVRLARVTTGLYAVRGPGRPRRIDARARDLDLLVYVPAYHALQRAAWFQPVLAGSRIAMSTNSTLAIAAAARAGAGVAVLPRFVAASYPDLVEVSDDLATDDLWLVTHPEFRRDPKVRAVAAFLREAGRELA